MNFEKAVDWVMGEEGGYVNDPADPGGETKWGISKRSYPALNIKDLAASDAVRIYRVDYWDALRIGELPRGLDLLVFDAAVNQGQGAAARMLQQAASVKEEGVIGAVTLAAAKNVTIPAYAARRMGRYAVTPGFQRYWKGWGERLMKAVMMAGKDAGV